jgi:hypothetical protein
MQEQAKSATRLIFTLNFIPTLLAFLGLTAAREIDQLLESDIGLTWFSASYPYTVGIFVGLIVPTYLAAINYAVSLKLHGIYFGRKLLAAFATISIIGVLLYTHWMRAVSPSTVYETTSAQLMAVLVLAGFLISTILLIGSSLLARRKLRSMGRV